MEKKYDSLFKIVSDCRPKIISHIPIPSAPQRLREDRCSTAPPQVRRTSSGRGVRSNRNRERREIMDRKMGDSNNAVFLRGAGIMTGGLLCSGCRWIQELNKHPMVETFLDYAPGFIWSLSKWSVGGGIAGLLLAVVVFFALRAVGGFRWKWRYAGYFRLLALVLILLATVIIGILIGANEGLYRGLRQAADSKQMQEDLQAFGKPGADVLGGCYILVAHTSKEMLGDALKEMNETHETRMPTEDQGAGSDYELPPRATPALDALQQHLHQELERFRTDAWQLDLAAMREKARERKKLVIASMLPVVKDSIRADYPTLKEGKDAQMFDWFVDNVGRFMLERAIDNTLTDRRIKGPVDYIWEGLQQAGGNQGDPNTLSYSALAGYLPTRVLYATIVFPVKLFVRGNQTGLVISWVVLILGLVAFFQSCEFIRGHDFHGRSWRWVAGKFKARPKTAES